jgi:serine/threonine protein kinase
MYAVGDAEHLYGERLTDKVDVYSYGVVLLEMITRKRPTSAEFVDGASLRSWVQSKAHDKRSEAIDPALMDEAKEEEGKEQEVYHVLAIALACAREAPRDRPPMMDVLDSLLSLRRGKPSSKLYSQALSRSHSRIKMASDTTSSSNLSSSFLAQSSDDLSSQ